MTEKIQFISSHRPALELGDYSITIEQRVSIKNPDNTEIILLGEIPGKEHERAITEKKFSILGPRFSLDPQEIQAAFPPPGSLGEHSNVLPHVILKRSTLPWERSAQDGQEDVPWLALLLFDEGEAPQPVPPAIHVADLKTLSTAKFPKVFDRGPLPNNAVPPYLKLESGDHDNDQLVAIDVPKKLLSSILPLKDELKLLAHVRQTTNAQGTAQGDEVAVIICNRLPKSGNVSIVHLVSLEGRYDNQGFNYQGAQDDDLIRLISLYSWRFACVSERHTFKSLLMHLNHQLLFNVQDNDELIKYLNGVNNTLPDVLKQAFMQSKNLSLENIEALKVVNRSAWKIEAGKRCYFIGKVSQKLYDQAGRFINIISQAPNSAEVLNEVITLLNLPASAKIQEDAAHWWMGTNKEEYFIIQEPAGLYGYHLDPDDSSILRLPGVKNKDESINVISEHYLARGCVPLAHEMRQGNKSVSWYHGPFVAGSKGPTIPLTVRSGDELVLYDQTIGMFDVSYSAAWELGRLLTLQNKQVSIDLFNWKRSHAQSLKDAATQLSHLPFDVSTTLALPDSVRKWFENLALLVGLPFNYLVPDERMLPAESIRFFQVDLLWVKCLRDGAFSIGRVLQSDHERDREINHGHITDMSGFLLRSDVVSGWPGLLVDGYVDNDFTNVHSPKRMDRLSKNVLLCVFEGIIKAIDIHLKPETMHFGISRGDDESSWYKNPRQTDGSESSTQIPIPFRSANNPVLDISQLIDSRHLNVASSSQFAVQMIEGVEKVRFVSS